MIEHAFRLKYGQDLKFEIENYCKENKINTAIILSGVGCVYEMKIRLAKAKSFLHESNDYEIVSLNGTISCGHAHLHIALSDYKGDVIGGHLMEGTKINTTCEVVLIELESYQSNREFDEDSGYDEIKFERIKNGTNH